MIPESKCASVDKHSTGWSPLEKCAAVVVVTGMLIPVVFASKPEEANAECSAEDTANSWTSRPYLAATITLVVLIVLWVIYKLRRRYIEFVKQEEDQALRHIYLMYIGSLVERIYEDVTEMRNTGGVSTVKLVSGFYTEEGKALVQAFIRKGPIPLVVGAAFIAGLARCVYEYAQQIAPRREKRR